MTVNIWTGTCFYIFRSAKKICQILAKYPTNSVLERFLTHSLANDSVFAPFYTAYDVVQSNFSYSRNRRANNWTDRRATMLTNVGRTCALFCVV